MMRLLVALMLAGNLGFWAWSAGWLGGKAQGDREPERLQQQVRPEAVRVVASTPLTRPDAVAPAARAPDVAASAASPQATAEFGPDCLEAGPFTPSEVVAAEAALVRAALPANSWVDVAMDMPGQWIIYMGRYADVETLERKEAELARLRITPERLEGAPDLEPGLVLGRFASRSAADDALGLMTMRGLQTARVVAFAPPRTRHVLRADKPGGVLKAQLVALSAPALGKGFVRCGTAAAAAAMAMTTPR